ncbi:hypothetical protein [Vibrio maerlii]|uniref:hypothetical protein n=1 Tax=Vibrio maerlii TaxID=2231648 RepID=UPI000E3E6FD2|nr:hypothetical protein [Vibrio maerlii]
MNIVEVKERVAGHDFLSAHIIHDINTTGWHIHLVDSSGNEFPITDDLNMAITYGTLAEAQSVVRKLDDMPVQVDRLYRQYAI